MVLFNKIFKTTLLFIFLAELLSLFGYLLPEFGQIAFFAIIALALILSLIKLEYGLWMLLAELFIGSKGYLFFFEHEGMIISIRIALWLVVMAVWLGQILSDFMKKKSSFNKTPEDTSSCHSRPLRQSSSEASESGNPPAAHRAEGQAGVSGANMINKISCLETFHHSPYSPYFLILFIFITWGLINGFLNHNEFSDIFFDFNGWLYFTLVFPVYSVLAQNNNVNVILQIFTASITWLCAKTFLLLFIFSHNITGIAYELYRWARSTGVGEITQIQGGFYRVFFQSHIFVLIGFFMFLLLILNKQKEKQEKKFLVSCFLFLVLFLSVILISFSRSFWIGLAVGLLIYWFIDLLVYRAGWKKFFINNGILLFSAILSIGIIVAVVKFPYPKPIGGFSATDLLSERAGQITGEAGVSSRWSLLPELWNEIKQAPILGQGFGATVTYKSSDPRVLQYSASGEYATYAFEWGWLDIWLKLGFFGMLAYLLLIGRICYDGLYLMQKSKISAQGGCASGAKIQNYNAKQKIYSGLTIGLLVVAVVSIFSPYMNHPLGIGYLILTSAILDLFPLRFIPN